MTEEYQEFLAAIARLSSLAFGGMEAVRQEIIESLAKTTKSELPSKLYHYTSLSGATGILRSNNLWATDFRFLNDSTELVYGAQLLAECLRKYCGEEDSHKHALLARLANFLVNHGNTAREVFETFVISLSEEPDKLSQWRAYGDQGRGYCLEFDFSDSRLFTIVSENTPWAFDLLPVLYRRDTQETVIHEGISRFLNVLARFEWSPEKINLASQMEQYVFLGFMMHVFGPFTTALKDSAFEEEKEWRAVTQVQAGLTVDGKKRRAHGSEDRYYVESIFVQSDETRLWQRELLPIKSIWSGPLAPNEEQEILREVIQSQGYGDSIALKGSRIPLRS